MPICVATKKLIETHEGVHLDFSGGANRKNGGAQRGLDRATSRVQLLGITWRGDFFVWIESVSGSGDFWARWPAFWKSGGGNIRLDVTMKQPKM